MSNYFDSYNIFSRFFPTYIMLSPIGVEALVILSYLNILDVEIWAIPSIIFVIIGAAFMIFVRYKGRKFEENFFAKNGGSPAVKKIRFSNNDESAETNRTMLSELFSEYSMPTEEEEKINQKDADLRYQKFINLLRENTRDKSRFVILFEENKTYGFIRNTFAVRKIAICLSVIAIAVNFMAYHFKIIDISFMQMLIGDIGHICIAGCLIFIFNEKMYVDAAEKYTEKLYDALTVLYHDKLNNKKSNGVNLDESRNK